MSNLSDLIKQAEAQAQNINRTNNGNGQNNMDSVSLRGSVPTTYGFDGNAVNIRGSHSLSEGVDFPYDGSLRNVGNNN